MTEQKERAIITDKLVVAQTGKTMEEWFAVLDERGAQKLAHAEIFDRVASIDGLKPLGQWNQNLLTTTYEWNRGLKERGQKEDGFEISVSKTIKVPISELFRSWVDNKIRKDWLDEEITIRKSTENKSARITWSDSVTSLSVDFYPKGEGKSQVVVQHLKIPDSDMAKAMKEYWGEKLDKLKASLER
jgi:uncharacterized protein YndB with AHSA1/START domain